MTLLESAITASQDGPAALDAWLDQNPAAVDNAFGRELKQFGYAAIENGSLNAAVLAFAVAGIIFERLNDVAEVLSCRFNHVQIMYMTAETTDAYAQAHSAARTIAANAVEAGLNESAFSSFSLAADSAYWAADVAPDAGTRRAWLRKAMETILEVGRIATVYRPDASAPWQRLVSCLVVTYQTTQQQEWGVEQSEIDALLHRLAAFAEQVVPVGFTFDDPQKTVHVAYNLADLSTRYGTGRAAEGRLRSVQQQVKRDEWSE